MKRNNKKKQEQRQKEVQKRESENASRKHLQGLRVVQKNLVYVVGLSPSMHNDHIYEHLRGDQYFGQYGKIVKIVVSKAKHSDPSGQSLGIYITFDTKEEAARCIQSVNGSLNGDRVLRAQLGTTKYCSAYLRSEQCTNKQCMFLHEPGDNDESFSRQDLSSMNSERTQRPLQSSATFSRRAAQVQAPIQQAHPVTAATQPMARESSKDGADVGNGPALPSSASWGNRQMQQLSRRGSHATASGATSSAAVQNAMPATAEIEEPPQVPRTVEAGMPEPVPQPEMRTTGDIPALEDGPLVTLLKAINTSAVSFTREVSESDVDSYPLFDEHGGEKRRLMREQQEASEPHIEQETIPDVRSVAEPLDEEEPESGSLQLGGEPEESNARDGSSAPDFSRRPSLQLPIQRVTNAGAFGSALGQSHFGNLSSINGRTLTREQQAQLMAFKSQSGGSFMDQLTPGLSNPLGQFGQQGHTRQSSRYSFANESKPSANPKTMSQQASMMPSGSQAQHGGPFYGSAMPAPPPGLKSAGTPPIGGMFGQGHVFGGNVSAFCGQKGNDDMFRDMLRARNGAGSSQSHDAGKREYMFPSFLNQYPSASSTPAPTSGLLASLYGPQTGAFHDFGQKQKKKGKKHRHANTSSSGGSGLVDLADPSILQARMQHQQQSNAGVGQGLFGGQAQGGYNNPSMMYGTGFSRW